jgi:microsomal dipeptidase-like Zn-dependent dipeptidase
MFIISLLAAFNLSAQITTDPKLNKAVANPVLNNTNINLTINNQNPLCEYRPNEAVKYIFYDNVNMREITNRLVPEAEEYISVSTMIEGREYTLVPASGVSVAASNRPTQNLALAETGSGTNVPRGPSLWKVIRSGNNFSLMYSGSYTFNTMPQINETGGYLFSETAMVKVGSGGNTGNRWIINGSTEGGFRALQLQSAADNKILGYCYREGQSITLNNQTRRVVTEAAPAMLGNGETLSGKRCVYKWNYKIYRLEKALGQKKYPAVLASGNYFINLVTDNQSLLPFIDGIAFGETKPAMEEMQWQVEQTSRGSYFIINKKRNLAIAADGRDMKLRLKTINRFDFYETDSMQWVIRGPFEGKYTFAPVLNNKAPNSTQVLTTKNKVVAELERYSTGSYWQEFIVDSVNGPLWGYVDMHTHPMSHLAFAGKNFHGAPDVGSLMFAGTIHRDAGFDVGETKKDCNTTSERAKSVAEALGNCNGTHGGWGTDNNCGDYLRNGFIGIMEGMADHAQSAHGSNVFGYHPDKNLAFTHWPKWNDMTHQKMWVDWIKMAYESGLRVMVALAHNNQVMAQIIAYNDPGTAKDDATSADLQVKEIIDFVNRHKGFMEIAFTPADLYRINKSNKLAVIPGIEMDFLGNFPLNLENNTDGQRRVENEINRLYASGVRYIFPIHLSDNAFGGTAIYEDLMNVMQKLSTGTFWKIECSKPADSVNHVFEMGLDSRIRTALQAGLPLAPALLDGITHLLPLPPGIKEAAQPVISAIITSTLGTLTPMLQAAANAVPDAPPTCGSLGHRNAKGLTPLGVFAVKKMMQKGMIIDVDHMSQYGVDSTLSIAEKFRYPVNSGHTGVKPASENQRSYKQLGRITSLGGLFGVGWSDQHAGGFMESYRKGMRGMGNRGVCFGSDINSIVFTPKPRPGSSVIYNAAGFPALSSYGHTWDYNRDGMPHYGLIRDFVRDIRNMGNTEALKVLYSSAHEFYEMWKTCERQKSFVR